MNCSGRVRLHSHEREDSTLPGRTRATSIVPRNGKTGLNEGREVRATEVLIGWGWFCDRRCFPLRKNGRLANAVPDWGGFSKRR